MEPNKQTQCVINNLISQQFLREIRRENVKSIDEFVALFLIKRKVQSQGSSCVFNE